MNTSVPSELLSSAHQVAGDIFDSVADDLPAVSEVAESVLVPVTFRVGRRLLSWKVALLVALAAAAALALWRVRRGRDDDAGNTDREQDVLSRIPTIDGREQVGSVSPSDAR